MLRGKGLLQPLQKRFLTFWFSLPDHDRFYLTGGTALAEFYLGHRISFDLDFFTAEEPLILPTSRRIEATAPIQGWEVSVIRRFVSFSVFHFSAGTGGEVAGAGRSKRSRL